MIANSINGFPTGFDEFSGKLVRAALDLFKSAKGEIHLTHDAETVRVETSGSTTLGDLGKYVRSVVAAHDLLTEEGGFAKIHGAVLEELGTKLQEDGFSCFDLNAAISSLGIPEDTLNALRGLIKSGSLKLSYDKATNGFSSQSEITLSKPELATLVENLVEFREREAARNKSFDSGSDQISGGNSSSDKVTNNGEITLPCFVAKNEQGRRGGPA